MSRFPVLMYHAISRVTGRRRPLGVEPSLFRDQLCALRDNGYELVGLTEGLDIAARQPTRNVVALTFDDAYRDFHAAALPILASLGGRATLYVPTQYVGGTPSWLGRDTDSLPVLMSWSALTETVDSGLVEIGSHSHSHPHLDSLGVPELRQELRQSKQILESKLGSGVNSLCYPNGYHDRVVRHEARAAGYGSACEVGRRLRSHELRWSISRLAVGPAHTPDRLVREVRSGGPIAIPYVKRCLQPAWRVVRVTRARTGVAR